MSLATRCTSCGTVFRVVQDQLRVSGGWVRCGRCSEVFNAVESLVNLEPGRGGGGPPSVHGPRVIDELTRIAGEAPAVQPEATVEAVPPWPSEPPAPESSVPSELPVDLADGPDAPAVPSEEAAEEEDRAEAMPAMRAEPDDAKTVPTTTKPPRFVRDAQRAAWWRRPQVRVSLLVLALAAGAVLAWQLAVTQHDLLAARWPVLRPWIERACAKADCTVRAPLHIEGLSVESSGLLRAGPVGAYRLQLVLRNRDSMALRMPHVDLSLTDALGKTLARRVLSPEELGARQSQIAAVTEVPLVATLRTRDARVVGYTIEIFYP